MFDNGRLPDAPRVTRGFVYIFETKLGAADLRLIFPKVGYGLISLKYSYYRFCFVHFHFYSQFTKVKE